jgi:hypothetical protein
MVVTDRQQMNEDGRRKMRKAKSGGICTYMPSYKQAAHKTSKVRKFTA